MKLCVISHAYVETANLPILSSMAAQPGVQLALITPDRYMLDLQSADGQFSEATQPYRIYRVPIRFGKRQGAFLYHHRALAQALDDFAPDLILHEQEVFALSALQVAFITRRRKLPLVMQVAENLPRKLILPRRAIRNFVLKRCEGLICWSQDAARIHIAWGFSKATAIIPGMAIAELNQHLTPGRRGGKSLNICFAGRLVPSKGIDCLLRAIALLESRGSHSRCSIAGHGPERAALEALAHDLHLRDTHFLGVLPQDRVLDLLRTSDALVLPSRRTAVWEEQFGRVLPQAMNEGTITIGTRTGAIPEVIGRDDLLFAEDDVQQLAAVLERLARNEAWQQELQHWLHRRAATLYLNDILAAQKTAFCIRVFAEFH